MTLRPASKTLQRSLAAVLVAPLLAMLPVDPAAAGGQPVVRQAAVLGVARLRASSQERKDPAPKTTKHDGEDAARKAAVQRKVDRADRYLRMAERYPAGEERNRTYSRAEALAEEILEENPDCADAHFLLFAARGRRLMQSSRATIVFALPSLNAHLNRALELNPRHARALAVKGGVLLDLPSFLGGDLAEAKRYLTRATELNPTGVGTRLSLAKALLREGRREDARKQLRLAAHYACVKRNALALSVAGELLAGLDG